MAVNVQIINENGEEEQVRVEEDTRAIILKLEEINKKYGRLAAMLGRL